jgi:hypothetical protein
MRGNRRTVGSSSYVSAALRINGQTYTLDLEPRVTLPDALPEYAGLIGTKKGCCRQVVECEDRAQSAASRHRLGRRHGAVR